MSNPAQPSPAGPAPKNKPVGVGTRIARVAIALGIGCGLVVLGFWIYSFFLPAEDLFRLGSEALQTKKDYAAAEKYGKRLLGRDTSKGHLLLGMVASAQGKPEEAIEHFSQIPNDHSIVASDAHSNIGAIYLETFKQPSKALEEFYQAHQQDSKSPNPYNFIPYVLRLGTRTREMIPFEVWVAKNGAFFGLVTPKRLYELALGHGLHPDAKKLEEFRKASPDDNIVRLGLADVALYYNRFDEAEQHYRRVIETQPEILEAHVRLGQVYLQSHNSEKLAEWNAKLPPDAEKHPLTWSIRGKWADEQGQSKAATRCYWESVRLDSTHLPAMYRLGQLLVAEGKSKEAKPFIDRAQLLEAYVTATHSLNVLTDKPKPDIRQPLLIAQIAAHLGLAAEAYAWIMLTLSIEPNLSEAVESEKNLSQDIKELTDSRVLADPQYHPSLSIDLSSYPLPDFKAKASEPKGRTPVAATQVAFEDVAKAVGIDFFHFKGGDPKIRGLTRVYRFNGGGVAVLDYDCDGWPDIYLTQGSELPTDLKQTEHLDRLYRNTGDGRFEDVTESAGIAENQYSQGVTVGDFNSDGFPDLYVANLGPNRFYRNNGDGTFDDITESSGTRTGQWTSSCLMADLNGDGLPDIFDVNYLSGQEILTTVCRDESGKHHACMPLQFASSLNTVFLNQGNGTFENVTEKSGIATSFGKGLGIVAADFEGTGKLNLFVANDGVPNFYFVNEGADEKSPLKFKEEALTRGLAYNRNGTAQAGMGVAAGDSNGDGLLDLLVTNFYIETSTLYRQQPDHLFADDTEVAKLADPSRYMLGFGTQFLDGALRGAADLIVTNGHIDDLSNSNVPYEMPPQYFSNAGDGTFVELKSENLGPYFQKKYLGRGLARIDWNRDGKEDVVISHLDAPAAVLSNTTKSVGHHLSVRLVGVKTSRDAIGTTLTLKAGGKTQVRQLAAGDGYQSSNERVIVFGLGDATTVESLDVQWLTGDKQTFTNVAADGEYLCIQGAPELVKREF